MCLVIVIVKCHNSRLRIQPERRSDRFINLVIQCWVITVTVLTYAVFDSAWSLFVGFEVVIALKQSVAELALEPFTATFQVVTHSPSDIPVLATFTGESEQIRLPSIFLPIVYEDTSLFIVL